MPRAGPSRSQRRPSQTQTNRHSRSQRRAEDVDDDEEEVAAQNYEDDEEPGMDDDDDDTGTDDVKKRATDLVRLALFQEQKRATLRRDDISKRVMGSQQQQQQQQRRGGGGAFKAVFEQAQSMLRATFGMELVELPTRGAAMQHDGVDKMQERAMTQTQNGEEGGGGGAGDRQAVTGLRKKAVSQGSKTYILRSTLDPVLVERAATTNKRILEAEAADAPDDVDGAGPGVRTYGSLIAWNSADQLSALGILHVILALILVSGKVISDMDLRMLLRRLRLRPPTQLALPAHTQHRTLTLDAYLLQLQRQGYLDRTRIGGTGSTSQKRGRGGRGGGGGATQQGGSGAGEESDVAWEWRWGPRALAEIGEVAVARFVAEFMAERASSRGGSTGGGPAGRVASNGGGIGDGEASEEEGEGEGDGGRGRGRRTGARGEEAQRRLAALLRGVERAAGGELGDVAVS